MFETIISNQEENRKLSGIRDSLLPKLMNGEIEVRIVSRKNLTEIVL